MITNTTINNEADKIVVARLINRKYRKIEFGLDVKAIDLIPYFNLPDEMFMKLITRWK